MVPTKVTAINISVSNVDMYYQTLSLEYIKSILFFYALFILKCRHQINP